MSFGEIKCLSEADNNFAICKDLLRIGVFSKASLDTNDMKGVLSYQITGRLVVFYILALIADGFYVLYELTEITVPYTVDDLLKFTMDYSKLVSIIKIYNKWCIKNDSDLRSRRRSRSSISDGDFDELVEKNVDRKRPCVTKHHRN